MFYRFPRVSCWILMALYVGLGRSSAQDGTPPQGPICRPPEILQRWSSTAEFSAEQGELNLSKLPVRTDLEKAIGLGVSSLDQHMNWDRLWPEPLDDPQNRTCRPEQPERFPEQYWGSNYIPDGTSNLFPADRKHPLEISVSHAVGRTLWACLLAEETTRRRMSEKTFQVHRQYCRAMFDNIDRLPSYFDAEQDFERAVIGHDLREGFLALLGLMRVRHDDWARETARRMVRTLASVTDSEGHLSPQLAEEAGLPNRIRGMGCDATTSGRLVEPLIEYWEFTGDEAALSLAGRYAQATVKSAFTEEGRFKPFPQSGGHIHSITSSLAGIVRYALVAQDAELLEAARRILQNGVTEHFSTWGWGDEVTPDHPANVVSRGESNQTGDVIRAALQLGKAGHPEFYELAERYLRSMLLPTQYYEEDLRVFLPDNPNPQGDHESHLLERVTGGFAMQLPNDRVGPGVWPMTTQDILSGAVHALCACLRHRVTADQKTVQVNLLFGGRTEDLILASALPLEGSLKFVMKTNKALRVRIPEWVLPATLRLSVNGASREASPKQGYLEVGGLATGDQGEISFEVPCKREKEKVDGTEYTTTWVGNQVIEIAPRGAVSPLPFDPPAWR